MNHQKAAFSSRWKSYGLLPCFFACLSAACLFAADTDWTRWRGDQLDGRVSGTDLFSGSQPIEFELAYKRNLGSGYSSISVQGEFAVTMATFGQGDFVVAFEAMTGKEAWRFRLEDFFPGRSGADDGPLSTPTIDKDRVYALSARGRLVALELATGKLLWEHDLTARFAGEAGEYGRSTAPLVDGNRIFVATGGSEKRTVVAFHRNDGKMLWTGGLEDQVSYHNPTMATLLNQKQIVVPSRKHVFGLNPKDGRLLWQQELESATSDTQVLQVNQNRFLVASSNDLQLFELTKESQEIKVTQVWKSRALKHAPGGPVLIDHHLYGFNGKFLTCVALETGKVVWKSRPPGGQNLIAVDKTLLFWDLSGSLAAIRATPEGYQELGRIQLSKQTRVFSPPSFAQGRIFLRDLKELYAVTPKTATAVSSKTEPSVSPKGILAELADNLKSGNTDKVMKDFAKKHPTWPITDKNGWVHFLYQGKVDDLAIVGDMTGGYPQKTMHKMPGADLYFRSFKMEPGNRWEYQFAKFEERFADPKNPNKMASGQREKSIYAHADWRGFEVSQPVTAKHKGSLTSLEIKVADREEPVEMKVYLPANQQAKGKPLPFVIVARGKEALEQGHYDQILDDRAMRGKNSPLMVFLHFPNHYWYSRYNEDTAEILNNLVLPKLQEHFQLSSKREERMLLAQDWSVPVLLRYVLVDNQSFGKVAFQSACFEANFERSFLKPYASNIPSTQFLFEWGRYDRYTPDFPLDVAQTSRNMSAFLKSANHQVSARQVPGGFGWVPWQTRLNPILDDFLGKQ